MVLLTALFIIAARYRCRLDVTHRPQGLQASDHTTNGRRRWPAARGRPLGVLVAIEHRQGAPPTAPIQARVVWICCQVGSPNAYPRDVSVHRCRDKEGTPPSMACPDVLQPRQRSKTAIFGAAWQQLCCHTWEFGLAGVGWLAPVYQLCDCSPQGCLKHVIGQIRELCRIQHFADPVRARSQRAERAKTLHGEPNGYLWQRWGATSSPHYSLLRHQTTFQCANLATNNHHPDAT